MLELQPDRIYVTHDVYDDPQAAARADRLIAAMQPSGVERVGDAELDRLAQERGWDCDKRWGQRTDHRDPDIVLTTGKFHDEAARKARLERHPGQLLWPFTERTTFEGALDRRPNPPPKGLHHQRPMDRAGFRRQSPIVCGPGLSHP